MGDVSTPAADVRARVEEALRTVRNPSMGTDVYEAGLVHDVSVDGRSVTVELDGTALDPSAGRGLADAVVSAVGGVDAVEDVRVRRVQPRPEPGERDRDGFEDVDTVLAVASAKGGVGKSTVAVGLACALADDRDVGVFDADIFGPNVPTLLDAEGPVRADEEGRPEPVEVGGLEAMSVGFLTEGGPLAWRGSVAHDAVTDLAADTAWTDRDVVVIDLPPGTSDVVLTVLQEIDVDGVLFVTTPFEASVEDTGRSVDLFREEGVPVLGTVINMARHTCPSCGDDHPLFDGAADPDLDAPVLAELPFDGRFQGPVAPGDPPEPIAALADRVEERLAAVPEIPEDALDLRGRPPEERYEAVREAYGAGETGEEFHLVSDRDPSPVREFLGELADAEPEAFAPFEVRRRGLETWVLRTVLQ